MILTRKGYKKALPQEVLKQAKKCRVRECDEISKGKYLAYVDENNNSFDVEISFNTKDEIVEHSCDCNNKIVFCRHKAALLITLNKTEKSLTKKSPPGKKTGALDTILDGIDTESLKGWLKEILVRNKELEVAFTHRFSPRPAQYKPSEIRELTLNAFKAVSGRKINLESGDVKKLLQLWSEIHALIINGYLLALTDKDAFLNFDSLLDTCCKVIVSVRTPGTKLEDYMFGILKSTANSLHQLKNESDWETAISYFTERMDAMHFNLLNYYLYFAVELFNLSEPARRAQLVQQLVAQYQKGSSTAISGLDNFTGAVFSMVTASGQFYKYMHIFKPSSLPFKYRSEFISLLINEGQFPFAEKVCKEQISESTSPENNATWLHHLKKIYTLTNDVQNLKKILHDLIPLTLDFEDFKFVYEQMNGEQKKKWRTKISTRAGHLAYHSTAAKLFSFRLMAYEQNYKKMINSLGRNIPYNLILQYAEPMILVDRDSFIRQLFAGNRSWSEEHQTPEENFQQMLNLLLKHYREDYLKLVIKEIEKQGYYFRQNPFMTYVIRNLP